MPTTPSDRPMSSGQPRRDAVEVLRAAEARTDQLCAVQPAQAKVREALLRAEKVIHKAGWDGPPVVFHLGQNERSGRIRYAEFEDFSQALVDLPHPAPVVLGVLAQVSEDIRTQIQAPASEADRFMRNLPPEYCAAFRHARRNPDGDLFLAHRPGWRFHGVGVIVESWAVSTFDATARALAAERKLHTHPGRIEMRDLVYAARDGWVWRVTRYRQPPEGVPTRSCVATNPENDLHIAGTVPNAMTRMCNAIASNPVPVASTGRAI